MDKNQIIEKIEALADLKHRATMKHINADRMGDSSLRRHGNELDDKFDKELEQFALMIVNQLKH